MARSAITPLSASAGQLDFLHIVSYEVTMRELSKEEAIEFVKSRKSGNLALCDRHQPYCIPIAYTHTDAALLHYQRSRGRTLEYLEANQRPCFEIHDKIGNRSS